MRINYGLMLLATTLAVAGMGLTQFADGLPGADEGLRLFEKTCPIRENPTTRESPWARKGHVLPTTQRTAPYATGQPTRETDGLGQDDTG